ncbi:MAG TPA: hypothetical protein VMV07_12090 [Streptosporangiaceae bacterium]|nr:hypothetical protein [Streptosporangiaceae bacterium]
MSVHYFELDVVDDPAILMRIMTVCQQRTCRIASLHYQRGNGAVSLSVDAEPERAARLELWLDRLVHVMAVRVTGSSDSLDRFSAASS